MMLRRLITFLVFVSLHSAIYTQSSAFVTVRGHSLYRGGKQYRFVGANYWYGSLLGLESDPQRGLLRLRKDLDFLKANGVTNLRLMAGAEGSGPLNGVMRVGPPLQPEPGKFDEGVLQGLDRVLYEMGKRRMTAVIFLSNNWEWSGGFQQYLLWNSLESSRFIAEKPTWDEYRDIVSRFYSCEACKAGYLKQVEAVIDRTNKFSGKRYRDGPAIMAWELANEPRPMRAAANDAYRRWINESAAFIKSRDKNHLVNIGHEGWIGTQDINLYEEINNDKNIGYLTIHIWPKNWGWLSDNNLEKSFPNIVSETAKYIEENVSIAAKLDKPLVVEEFGLPRDRLSFDSFSSTVFRDRYYSRVLSFIGGQPGGNEYIAGADFWAFGGSARPIMGQTFWKQGDEYIGDPPMEEQGLNSVFDSDRSTWRVIRATGKSIFAKTR